MRQEFKKRSSEIFITKAPEEDFEAEKERLFAKIGKLEAVGESEDNLKVMRLMDEEFLLHPTHGVLQMQDFLLSIGLEVNVKRVRRLLQKMGIMAIYPQKSLSKLGQTKYIRPYLLKGLSINRANQVWAIDITLYSFGSKLYSVTGPPWRGGVGHSVG